MFNNVSIDQQERPITYPIADSLLPFCDYIIKTRAIIAERRTDLNYSWEKNQFIIEANSPFELYPENPILSGNKLKYGALLIHGLLDCPFSLRDMGRQLQKNGILSRAILLPGHGTTPSDLLKITFQEWIQAVYYGIESLRSEVEKIILIGYSTGATLSVYHALKNTGISNIILLSPAIQIKAPVNIAVTWHKFTKLLGKHNKRWMYREEEMDYAKYHSITFNSIAQVSGLTHVIRDLRKDHALEVPICMVVSREDETISSHRAIDFFSNLHHPDSRLLLYSSIDHRYPDERIHTRISRNSLLHIKHYSHSSIPFAPYNLHYGENGDYYFASRPGIKETIYGAYNHIEAKFFDFLYSLSVTQRKRRELTYNPDFDFMAQEIINFIKATNTSHDVTSNARRIYL